MCLAQGPQGSDTDEARTHGPSVSSQALYHWAKALPYQKHCVVSLSKALYPLFSTGSTQEDSKASKQTKST